MVEACACDKYKDELSALLDNQVSAALKSEIDEHMLGCEDCKSEYASLESMSKFLGSSFKEPAEMPDLWAKMAAEVPSVCDVILDDLSAYLDGELTSPAQEGVNLHLKECADCLAKFTALNQTNRLLAKGLELPATVNVELWSAIKERLSADCALIDNELSAYLDQEVVTLRHREITKHLTDCAACQSEFAKLTTVGDIIRDAYKPEIPENFDLWPGIQSKLQVVPFTPKAAPAAPKVTGIDRRYYAFAAVAAVFVLVFGLGAFWLNSPEQSSIRQVSAEGYLIDSSLLQPADKAEAVVYEE